MGARRERIGAWTAAAVVAAVAVGAVVSAATVAAAQEVPILAARLRPGVVALEPQAPRSPQPKVVDGDPSDWIGEGTGLAGTTLRSAGELVYEDFVFDAHGADDGLDTLLAGVADLASGILPVLDRPLRQGPIVAGILTNSYLPGSRPMHIGDAAVPAGRREAADLTEVRLAPGDGGLVVLARTGQMRQPGDVALLVLIDVEGPGASSRRSIPFGAGLHSQRADLAALISDRGVIVVDLRDGSRQTSTQVAVRPESHTNAIEALVPLPDDVAVSAIAVGSGYADESGTGFLDVGPGSSANLVNVAFRREPVSVAMDEAQALMLAAGSIDSTFTPIDLDALRAGATDRARPGPGYYEALFTSTTPGVATEDLPRQGARQHYALYLPTTWRPDRPAPTTMWLHYGQGDTHHLGAFLPNLVQQLGEERGNVLVGPSGRGELTFFGGAGYADVFEALADSDRFGRDPDRTSIAGYSMGNYGSMLLTALHPDLWAGALGIDGTPPSFFDGWTQNVANAAPVRFVLMGFFARSQMKPDYVALRDAGADARLYLYPTDHYTNIIVDQWRQLTQALGQPVRDRTPERVRYTRVPAIERAVGTGRLGGEASVPTNPAVVPVVADGAFWVDGIEVRDGDPDRLTTTATVDATTDGHGHQPRRAVPESSLSIEGAATPYLMEGVRHEATGERSPRADTFSATLTNVAGVHLDLDGMGLCAGAPITGTVTTDGPSALHLHGPPGDEGVTIELPAAGTHELQVTCGTPVAEVRSAYSSPPTGVAAAAGAVAGTGAPRLPATGHDASPLLAAVALTAGLALRVSASGSRRSTDLRRGR